MTATQFTDVEVTGDQTIAGTLDVTGAITPASSQAIIQKIAETVAFGAFTDGGGATGTYELSTIPIGATVLRCVLAAPLTGFAGDTSATIQVGDGTDVDRYMTGTPDVFSDIAGGLDLGVVNGVGYHAVAKTPTITITVNADWGSVTAGAITIELYYIT